LADTNKPPYIVDPLDSLIGSTDGDTLNDILPSFKGKSNRNRPGPAAQTLFLDSIKSYIIKLNQKPSPISESEQNNVYQLNISLARMVLSLRDRNSENSLDSMLKKEYAGLCSNIEGVLQQVLHSNAISKHKSIEFGAIPPQSLLLTLQQLGIAPESEDEVENFLKQNNLWQLQNPGPLAQEEINRLKQLLQEEQFKPHNKSTPKPPEP
jgi:hypothetical protein